MYTSPNADAIQIETFTGNLRLVDQSSSYLLSDKGDPSNLGEFGFLDENGTSLNPSELLTTDNANKISLIKVNLNFKEVEKSIELSSHFYPRNFRYGKKMSYHE